MSVLVSASTAPAAPHRNRAVTLLAYAYGALVVAVLGYFLLGIPIQLTDCFGNLRQLNISWRQLMIGEFTQRSYLRPMLWADFKLVYDLSGGNYFWWFRGAHVAQVGALVALFIHVLRPRVWLDAVLVPFGLSVLIGMHTFTGTVNEAFPVNTFLTMMVACLAAVALATSRYRWWNDVIAVLLFAFAALAVETGLLVWVVFITAGLLGARGVSRRGVAALVLALAAYFVLRFSILHVGSPGLVERSSGFGFSVLDPKDLIARWGGSPLPFYAYNIVSSIASVLFSEPRAGVFRLVGSIVRHETNSAFVVNVVASTLATCVIALYAWRRRSAWRARAFTHEDRIVLLFVAILGANAVISYPYTKDVIMSPAGLFFALAVFVAVRDLLARCPVRLSLVRAIAIGGCCVVLGVTWGVRDIGQHMGLRRMAFSIRNDWAYADQRFAREHEDISDPPAQELKRHLQDDAMIRHPAPVYLWLADNRLLDVNR